MIRPIISILILSLALAACQKKEPRRESELVRAYKLIDQQRDEDAIAVLEAELDRLPEDHPERTRVIVALASAHAHRAGIRVQSFARFLQAGKVKLKFNDNLKVTTTESRANDIDHFAGAFARILRSVSGVLELYAAIPTIKDEDEPHLRRSMEILDSLGSTRVTAADALYRAVIKGVYLKNFVATHVLDREMSVEIDPTTCDVDFGRIGATLSHVAQVTIEILDDLSIAQPKKAESHRRTRERMVEMISGLTMLTESASLIDEAVLLFAKTALIETGMRNLIKCQSSDAQPSSSDASPFSAL